MMSFVWPHKRHALQFALTLTLCASVGTFIGVDYSLLHTTHLDTQRIVMNAWDSIPPLRFQSDFIIVYPLAIPTGICRSSLGKGECTY